MTESPRTIHIAIGRALALCVHPYAAWRTRSRRDRWVLVCAYAGAGYVITLGALASSLATP